MVALGRILCIGKRLDEKLDDPCTHFHAQDNRALAVKCIILAPCSKVILPFLARVSKLEMEEGKQHLRGLAQEL